MLYNPPGAKSRDQIFYNSNPVNHLPMLPDFNSMAHWISRQFRARNSTDMRKFFYILQTQITACDFFEQINM